jgi:hypothetical protein
VDVVIDWVHDIKLKTATGLGIKHSGYVHRNGTVHLDVGYNIKIPRWSQWPKIVEMAEDLGAHKDFYQVDFEVGSTAATSRLLEKATRLQQIEDNRVIVSDVNFSPSYLPFEESMLDEIGRLWLAGYQMRIYKAIPNDESRLYMAG